MSVSGFAAWLAQLISPYEPILKAISYVVGPIFAAVAFVWNRQDRRELVEKGEALGTARAEAERAREALEASQLEVRASYAKLEQKRSEIAKLEQDLRSITEGSQELWKLRPARQFDDYLSWLRDPAGAKLISIGNLKGGVGKTTLAANLAAYISVTRNKPVLVVDLDYQGSLSNMLMLAIGREEVESRVDWLFEETAGLETLDRAAIHLVPKLSQGWLVPANYTFAQIENRLLLKWLLQQDGGLDVRYRLAHTFLRPEIRRKYAAIIFDLPPRMTLGTINALVASHALVVPTILDSLSVEAVSQFITNMKAIKADLGLDIDLAGIVGMMTRNAQPGQKEQRALSLAQESGKIWNEDVDYVFRTTLPRRVAIADAAGEDIAYFLNDAQNVPLRSHFDPLFEEICASVWKCAGR